MKTCVDRVEKVRRHFVESAEVKRRIADTCVEPIAAAADLMAETYRSGGKVLLCGNGGSAADCQHMAAELVNRLTADFKRPGLAAIALTTDTSFITAFANDCDFEGVFERQVETLGRPGDTLIAITTSGRSPNVVRAVSAAGSMGLRTIAVMGPGGHLDGAVDVAISVPSANAQCIQEAHLAIEHMLCHLVERILFGDEADKEDRDQ